MAAQPLGSLGSSADRNLLAVALKMGEQYESPFPPPSTSPCCGNQTGPSSAAGGLDLSPAS